MNSVCTFNVKACQYADLESWQVEIHQCFTFTVEQTILMGPHGFSLSDPLMTNKGNEPRTKKASFFLPSGSRTWPCPGNILEGPTFDFHACGGKSHRKHTDCKFPVCHDLIGLRPKQNTASAWPRVGFAILFLRQPLPAGASIKNDSYATAQGLPFNMHNCTKQTWVDLALPNCPHRGLHGPR